MIFDTLVILPARGGSKRIHKKNIAPLYGKPMIHWPLEILVQIFPKSHILLSTDDDKIKDSVKFFEIETEYTRPEKLSDDQTTSLNIISDARDWFVQNRHPVKYIFVVYPTAVLLKRKSVIRAFDLLGQSSAEVVLSSTNFGFPIQRGFSVNSSYLIKFREPEYFNSRSQDLDVYYHDAGQFYLFKDSVISADMDLSVLKVATVTLKRTEVVDIDEPEDMELAELFLQYQQD